MATTKKQNPVWVKDFTIKDIASACNRHYRIIAMMDSPRYGAFTLDMYTRSDEECDWESVKDDTGDNETFLGEVVWTLIRHLSNTPITE